MKERIKDQQKIVRIRIKYTFDNENETKHHIFDFLQGAQEMLDGLPVEFVKGVDLKEKALHGGKHAMFVMLCYAIF